ncbi:MAG: CoB--CoM heterodisulfide reductase iron-sulfur subunit B family protein [Desulfotignum sp.]|nr:CoB--CoM heterodisulfide reductase iron-sulfur subunit B family protein [Desulfotignum sp.]MCF8112740.1 CoB--CoM heterodisulfide reductase iron-sulfur subunit B family protein [Desulfotignum sp.]
MDYLYYPGCSLEGTAMEYDRSCRALSGALGMALVEISDWTCCGATAARCVDELLSVVLPARNLALAEKTDPGIDILVPCSACYLNLETARETIRTDPVMRNRVNQILAPDNLVVTGSNRVRHLLDVLSRDGAADQVAARAGTNMADLVIAPYYGCQCLRPFHEFDDPELPRSMDRLIRATGAQVLEWDMGGTCCGAATATTRPGVGQALVGQILAGAKDADAVVTVCPMCQMNLERFQPEPVPVLYLPQFLGLAMGLSSKALGCGLNLSDVRPVVIRGAP